MSRLPIEASPPSTSSARPIVAVLATVAAGALMLVSRDACAATHAAAAMPHAANLAKEIGTIAKEVAPAKPAPTVGKWIAPVMYIGAFALLANGVMHLDPARKKASEVGVGIITAVAGLMWWPFLVGMMMAQGLGALTNIVTGLAGMYSFFFIALGFTQIFKVPKKQLGAVAIFIGWLTGAYAAFFLTTAAPTGGGTWVYHFTITLVWFIAMNCAGLLMQGRMNERLTGWVVSFAAIYTFAIPALMWSMAPGHQGPF